MTEQTSRKNSTFAVAVEPEFDDNNKWTGIVSAHIEEAVEDDLDEDELIQVRSVLGMLASCLELMERDEDFLNYVRTFFIETHQEMIEGFLEEFEEAQKPSFTRSEDGKVISLNFNTKTYGNA